MIHRHRRIPYLTPNLAPALALASPPLLLVPSAFACADISMLAGLSALALPALASLGLQPAVLTLLDVVSAIFELFCISPETSSA